ARQKDRARLAPGPPGLRPSGSLVLDVQLGATVLRTAFRIVRTIRVGVRGNRAALAVADRANQARGVDAVAGQVVVHGLGATLGQLLVVRVGALRVGVARHLDAQVGVTLQDLDGLRQDGHRVRTQGRLVEVEVHALQVDRDRDRAAVRADGLASLRVRALVVAVVDAVAVVVQVGAARRDRGRSRRRRRSGGRAQRDHDADRGQQVAVPVVGAPRTGRADGLVLEIGAVGDFGAHGDAVVEGALQAGADLGGDVTFGALGRGVRRRDGVLLLGVLVADAEQQVRVETAAFLDEVATEVQRGAVLAPVQ